MDNFHLLLNKPGKENAFVIRQHGADKQFDSIKLLSRRDKDRKEIGRKEELEKYSFENAKIPFAALVERQKAQVKLLCGENRWMEVELVPDYRLVVGLGNPSIYETSITLHHIFGFPYLPASAIKGVTRNHVLSRFRDQFLAEDNGRTGDKSKTEKTELTVLQQSEGFCRLFGCPKGSARKSKVGEASAWVGDIVFFDSYPITAPALSMDVMTVHYPDYYREGNPLPPADWQSPNPISFLTLKNDPGGKTNTFCFRLGLRPGVSNDQMELCGEQGTVLELAEKFLMEALTQSGIGAKTAVGYGYFQNPSK